MVTVSSFWNTNRELKQGRRRRQRERQKSRRFRLAKQQLCTCITLFSTFLCRHCTTTTWKWLISPLMENVNTTTFFFSLRIQLQKKIASIWPIERDGISAIKFEAARNPILRACLHGGGGPYIGEVKCGGSSHLSCKRDQVKMRDYMDRRITSPTWGPPPPCKQALSDVFVVVAVVVA